MIVMDTISKEQKVRYLKVYIQKAEQEKNTFEEYKASKKLSFLVPFGEAEHIIKKMESLVEKIDQDSIRGDYLNRNAILYYKERQFDQALDYAIESEVYNEKTGNGYNLNSVRIDIGNIYLHTQNYQKAKAYFDKAKNYYAGHTDYNHQRSYLVALYSLGKTYWKLNKAADMSAVITESEQKIPHLRPVHRSLETAYLNYLKGGLAFLQNEHGASQAFFEKALPGISQNGDFANEHVVYLYLGKIAWEQNRKEEAVAYFNKIDRLFHEKEFLNYDLREAYDYLIAYYKETGQPEKQLAATESLIALNRQFEREQRNITSTLHYEIEAKKLEDSKRELENQIKNAKLRYYVLVAIAATSVLILAVIVVRLRKQKKQQRLQYEKVIEQLKKPIDDQPVKTPVPVRKTKSELILQKKIQAFEREKAFLKPVKLDELAAEWNSNRTTVSVFLKEHKGGFNAYINKLRIDEALKNLEANPDIRSKNIEDIARLYGFSNAKTFTEKFKEYCKLTPSYFIRQLEQDALNS